jgi:hypothetical protein
MADKVDGRQYNGKGARCSKGMVNHKRRKRFRRNRRLRSVSPIDTLNENVVLRMIGAAA